MIKLTEHDADKIYHHDHIYEDFPYEPLGPPPLWGGGRLFKEKSSGKYYRISKIYEGDPSGGFSRYDLNCEEVHLPEKTKDIDFTYVFDLISFNPVRTNKWFKRKSLELLCEGQHASARVRFIDKCQPGNPEYLLKYENGDYSCELILPVKNEYYLPPINNNARLNDMMIFCPRLPRMESPHKSAPDCHEIPLEPNLENLTKLCMLNEAVPNIDDVLKTLSDEKYTYKFETIEYRDFPYGDKNDQAK